MTQEYDMTYAEWGAKLQLRAGKRPRVERMKRIAILAAVALFLVWVMGTNGVSSLPEKVGLARSSHSTNSCTPFVLM